jgi:hypothetical protein
MSSAGPSAGPTSVIAGDDLGDAELEHPDVVVAAHPSSVWPKSVTSTTFSCCTVEASLAGEAGEHGSPSSSR